MSEPMTPEQLTPESIDNYLAGRLSEAELDAMELAMLENPALQQQIMQHAELKAALTENSDTLLAEPIPEQGLWEKIAALIWQPQFAYSASLLLGLGIFFSLPQHTSAPGPVVSDVVYLDQTRSAKPVTVNLVSNRQFLAAIDIGARSPVSATLKQGSETLLDLKQVMPNEAGQLNIVLPPLEPGNYALNVSPLNGKSPTDSIISQKQTRSFMLNVRPEPTDSSSENP